MGVYLSQPYTDKTTHSGSNSRFQYASSSMQGWRTSMEDAHIMDGNIAEDTSIFGVFDGHGGSEVALFCQEYFIETLKKNPNFQSKNFKSALEETFLKMDEMLCDQEKMKQFREAHPSIPEQSQAGCTANVTLIYKNKVYCANAGDSRSVLSRQAGKSHDLSTDHKPEQDTELKRITEAGGFVTDGRINGNLNLSRAIGDLEYKQNSSIPVEKQIIISFPDVYELDLQESDEFILMGCDGIWETMTNQEIITYCRQQLVNKTQITTVIEDMLDKILAPDTSQGYGCDNMSTILIMLKDVSQF